MRRIRNGVQRPCQPTLHRSRVAAAARRDGARYLGAADSAGGRRFHAALCAAAVPFRRGADAVVLC